MASTRRIGLVAVIRLGAADLRRFARTGFRAGLKLAIRQNRIDQNRVDHDRCGEERGREDRSEGACRRHNVTLSRVTEVNLSSVGRSSVQKGSNFYSGEARGGGV